MNTRPPQAPGRVLTLLFTRDGPEVHLSFSPQSGLFAATWDDGHATPTLDIHPDPVSLLRIVASKLSGK